MTPELLAQANDSRVFTVADLGLPDLDLCGNSRATRKRIADLRKDQKLQAKYAAYQALEGHEPADWLRGPVGVTYLVRRGQLWVARKLDDDNFVYGMKAARDGIAEVIGGGDSRWTTRGVVWSTGRGNGGVTVILTPRTRKPE